MDSETQGPPRSPAADFSPAFFFMLSFAGQIHTVSATFEFEISSYFGLLNSSLHPPLLSPQRFSCRLHITTWQQATDKSRSAPYLSERPRFKCPPSPFCVIVLWLPVRILDQRASLMTAFSYFVFQWTLAFAVTCLSGCSTSSKDSVVSYFCYCAELS